MENKYDTEKCLKESFRNFEQQIHIFFFILKYILRD